MLHSSEYFSPEQVRDKRVLVVGHGEGGSDVASSATKTAASVAVWGRRYPDCAPRFVVEYTDNADYDEQEQLSRYHKPRDLLESFTISRAVRNLPLGVWSITLQGLTSSMAEKYGPNSMQGMTRAMTSRAWREDYYSSDMAMAPTKSGVVTTAAAKGLLDLVIAPSLTISGKEVHFDDAQVCICLVVQALESIGTLSWKKMLYSRVVRH